VDVTDIFARANDFAIGIGEALAIRGERIMRPGVYRHQ
jgi:hypothetical protein